MQSPGPSSPDGSTLTAALPYLAAVVTALLGYFGARFTGTAQQQTALNDAFRSLVEELQDERAHHIARISELESEVLRQRGAINNHLAKEDAYLRILQRNNIKPPEHH